MSSLIRKLALINAPKVFQLQLDVKLQASYPHSSPWASQVLMAALVLLTFSGNVATHREAWAAIVVTQGSAGV